MKMSDNPHRRIYPTCTIPPGEGSKRTIAASADEHVSLNIWRLCNLCFGASTAAGWHHDPATGQPIERNVGEMLMLMVSEIGEAMEAHRKSLMDDKLPHRLGIEVELADAFIRICDFAGRHGLDLGGAVVEKIQFNMRRIDHTPEARLAEGGKAY
jgi:NTP pyrophosphatase (non-canonical NTP hydrolase)